LDAETNLVVGESEVYGLNLFFALTPCPFSPASASRVEMTVYVSEQNHTNILFQICTDVQILLEAPSRRSIYAMNLNQPTHILFHACSATA
jgi:hypothetical protein